VKGLRLVTPAGRMCFWLAILLSIGAGIALAASPAEANHIPGATYTGTVERGGTVELTVSADGTAVTHYKVSGIPGFPGHICGQELKPGVSIPITNHTFSVGLTGLLSFVGSFPATQAATGTVEDGFCFSGTRTWTATTTAAPPPPPPPPPSPPPPAVSKPACIVPNVKNKKLVRAKAAITKAHCRVGTIKIVDSKTVKKGFVVSQKPRAGTRLANGGRVNMAVSRGPRH
jgi:PASTA domain